MQLKIGDKVTVRQPFHKVFGNGNQCLGEIVRYIHIDKSFEWHDNYCPDLVEVKYLRADGNGYLKEEWSASRLQKAPKSLLNKTNTRISFKKLRELIG